MVFSLLAANAECLELTAVVPHAFETSRPFAVTEIHGAYVRQMSFAGANADVPTFGIRPMGCHKFPNEGVRLNASSSLQRKSVPAGVLL
jgi:hypothetical protein